MACNSGSTSDFTYNHAMSMSVLARVISTLPTKVLKNGHLAYISPSAGPAPSARAEASPDPTPYQPGMIWRDWVQPNTQGIARSAARSDPDSGRYAGREPRFKSLSSATGVEDMKYSAKPAFPSRAR